MVSAKIPVAINTTATKTAGGLSLETNLNRKADIVNYVGDDTLAIVLTRKAFYFGPTSSFTKDFSNVRNKYYVEHLDGAPQLDLLATTMKLWAKAERRALSKQVIFIPTPEIPMPIVIQTMAKLKEAKFFDNIVLGSGLI